jgi:hypothetical protein
MADAPAYQPRWTKGQPGGSDILDRNLREIATALSHAFGVINDLRTTIVNITGSGGGSSTTTTVSPSALALAIAGDDGDDGLPGRPGRDGAQGLPGIQGLQGFDGEDGQDGMPGFQGVPGRDGLRGLPGLPGDDGDDIGIVPAIAAPMGIPLGTSPADPSDTGDVLRFVNGDSRVRGADGFYPYSRTVAGPYVIFDPAVLTIEDNAIVTVL